MELSSLALTLVFRGILRDSKTEDNSWGKLSSLAQHGTQREGKRFVPDLILVSRGKPNASKVRYDISQNTFGSKHKSWLAAAIKEKVGGPSF